jgi:hypothetical protein
MISIICVYNREAVLEDYLLKGLKCQIASYELILMDNRGGQFSSAAEALNLGGSKATSKYLMFVHQDVLLSSPDWMVKAEDFLDSIHGLGIAGVAGMIEGGRSNEQRGRNLIDHGNPPRVWSLGSPIAGPTEVQVLDECLTLIPREVFQALPFDEVTCSGWDLYAADYCLSAKEGSLGVYVLPLRILHGSMGHLTESYFDTLSKVLLKHRRYYRRINTTVESWSTMYPVSLQRKVKPTHKKLQRALGRASKLIGIDQRL